MDGSQPTHMKNVWRLGGDLSAPSRNVVASIREESLHFVEEHPPCGFGRRQQVVVAVERDQARSGYQRGEFLSGGQRLPVIVTRVQNQRRAGHLAGLVAHIDTTELLEESHGVLCRAA
ncbi:MAG: hypothetical protein QOJ24_4680 [Mycobacterium sp.]|nr:hypothetical protein [Mycobacterium sp.]